MKVVLQRSKASKVTIDGKVHGEIDHGYVALVSFTDGDNAIFFLKDNETLTKSDYFKSILSYN